MNEDISLCTKISGRLLDNALDMVASSVASLKIRGEKYSCQTCEELKPAVVSIANAIEIIVKAKIADVEWRAIFIDPLKASAADALAGKLKSIGLPAGIKKMENLCKICLPLSIVKEISKITDVRNKIAHYHDSMSGEEYAVLISTGVSIFLDFYKKYIFDSFYEQVDRTSTIGKDLKDVPEYVAVRTKALLEVIADMAKPVTYHFSECPDCLQGVYILKGEHRAVCLFCDYEIAIRDMAAHHSTHESRVKHCELCERGWLALHDEDSNGECWQCVVCGFYVNRPQIWIIEYKLNIYSKDSIREEYRSLNQKEKHN